MASKHNDGWKMIYEYECYVENGMVLRCIDLKGDGATTAYPYKKSKNGGWENAAPVKVETLRRGLKKGTYRIM